MGGWLSAAIAWRYLKAKKSHGAVSAIAVVSVVGVVVATAAIVCVLSVFNGFREVLTYKLDLLSPDITVLPARSKTIADVDSVIAALGGVPGVEIASASVSDQALAVAGGAEMPVIVKGVDPEKFSKQTSVCEVILPGGEFDLTPEKVGLEEDEYGESLDVTVSSAVASIGTAGRLGVNRPGENLFLFLPKRKGMVNMANPLASFVTDSITVRGIFQTQEAEYDDNMVITDMETARRLLQYPAPQATSVDISITKGADARESVDRIQRKLGPEYVVKDREMMHEVNFRMIEIEKWVTFLLLFFILAIASFNVISSVCMLVIEKQKSLDTLHLLGLTKGGTSRIFLWESLYIALTGGLGGILLGVGLCLVQEKFGLLKLGGDPGLLCIDAYPVKLELSDLAVALLPVLLIGVVTGWITSRFARKRVR